VILDAGQETVRCVRAPFQKEPDFRATRVNYDLAALMARSEAPA
jgi:hypothetical protein